MKGSIINKRRLTQQYGKLGQKFYNSSSNNYPAFQQRSPFKPRPLHEIRSVTMHTVNKVHNGSILNLNRARDWISVIQLIDDFLLSCSVIRGEGDSVILATRSALKHGV